jgi:hypothetical protein
VSRAAGYRIVAFGSTGGASAVNGVPSSKQKFRDVSVYVRLQVGQRFIFVIAVRLCFKKSEVVLGSGQYRER